MKTILQALIDEISYPVKEGKAENKLVARGLDPDAQFSVDVLNSTAYVGAVADTLISLLDAVNFSDSDISVSIQDADNIKALANRYYTAIGELDNCVELPTATFFSNF
jgi:FlaG/FlaF family flagellin (archaellin)